MLTGEFNIEIKESLNNKPTVCLKSLNSGVNSLTTSGWVTIVCRSVCTPPLPHTPQYLPVAVVVGAPVQRGVVVRRVSTQLVVVH